MWAALLELLGRSNVGHWAELAGRSRAGCIGALAFCAVAQAIQDAPMPNLPTACILCSRLVRDASKHHVNALCSALTAVSNILAL